VSHAPLLRFTGVSCRRGGRLLFEGLDLTLVPGDAVLLTGPNGAGKSSLIRIAAGLLPASAGTVERAAPAALADEQLALDPKLTLGQALAFWARLDEVHPAHALAAMGLRHLEKVPVRMLSTGQRKRAMLARVAGAGAKLWLLDEPANGLDADGLERLAALIVAHRDAGGAILAASHQPIGLDESRRVALG
jgi:heme exporter protein A